MNTDIFIFVFAAFVIARIPIVGVIFKGVNTMIHETGHALFSLVFGHGTKQINLFASTEGVAETLTTKGIRGWIPRILISLAGYPFASAMSLLLMYLLVQEKYNMICYILLGFVLVNFVLWVKNLYGRLWLIIFGGIIGSILYFDYPMMEAFLLKVIVAITFSEAIYTALVILYLSIKDRHNAGDATSLAERTFIPTVIWGLLFVAQALYFGYMGIQLWF